ncbi:hypothetical protein PLESTB_001141200 [Pleodorina starrii]|uniref:Uncharacterized protein n=1 Tax=Pleodorina starrii TaxID=330485 RepID=A0A9W6F5R6_9CHLO|nr:hypothetical protein PLESTM_000563400 [Pleodorina starrii]GLC56745.1 hypothetical protein PLESTB_001141200 [Pleodorina starrii]GLC66901.1 hypothetical protein PLESTF_000488500 [Pleodorina starrii]
MQTGMPQRSGEAGSRHSPTRTWVAEPPPFGIASPRFPNEARKDTPDYHVAYRDVTQPPRWTAKGWVGIDDYVKPNRGTAPSVYGTSSLVPPSGPPRHGTGLASLSPSCPNEVRLQELLMLQRRRVTPEPGPGAYEPRDVRQHRRFRRRQDPQVDGPFFLDQLPGGTTTRSKEIAPLLRTAGDSGLGPGDYDGLITKDRLMRSAPVFKLSTSDREGRTHHAKSLSISRSIQNGIDWHVPVIVQPATSSTDAAAAELRPGSPDAAAAAGDASPRSTADPLTASTTRPSTAERLLGLYGGPSRSTSPTASGGAEQYVGAPPPPPSQVSRAVRREHQRRPGDWDWNRLGANYRTTWTTLHGGAYSHGDHTPPRSVPVASPTPGASTAASQPSLSQGIYPIQEESSNAMRTDPSAEKQQPPQRQPYYVATFPVASGGEQGGATWPGNGRSRDKALMVTEEDLRRRRAAAEFASRAQQANTRVTDWQSKFAG